MAKTIDRATTEAALTEPLAVDAKEAARLLGISPRKLWELTNRGLVPCVRFGRSLRYPMELLREFVREQSTGSGVK
jgi:excisionase family DNA binding protein